MKVMRCLPFQINQLHHEGSAVFSYVIIVSRAFVLITLVYTLLN